MEWHIELSDEEYQQCLDFANGSAPTQREHRSGGRYQRSVNEVTSDTMRGKVAEVVVKKFLEQSPLEVTGLTLDFNIYPRGQWDVSDIQINGKRIAIKACKFFGRWLLLESKDINRGDIYDYYILVPVDKDNDGGRVLGFAYKNEIIVSNPNTLLLEQGDNIPNTNTELDADNHARHSRYLHNSREDWLSFVEELNE